MSARERREKHPRPAPNPPRSPGKAAKMEADRLEFYDEAMSNVTDLTNHDLAEMLGQLATYLSHRIDRTRVQLLVDESFNESRTNFDRHEANLARLQRHRHQAVSLLKLINMFDTDDGLADLVTAWAHRLAPGYPEERAVSYLVPLLFAIVLTYTMAKRTIQAFDHKPAKEE